MVIQTIQVMPQWQGWWCSFIIIYGSYICCLRFQPKSTTDIHWHERPHEFDQSHPPKERHMFQTSFHVIWTSHMTNGILTSHLTPYTCIHFTQDSTWSEPVTRSLTYTFHTRFYVILTRITRLQAPVCPHKVPVFTNLKAHGSFGWFHSPVSSLSNTPSTS